MPKYYTDGYHWRKESIQVSEHPIVNLLCFLFVVAFLVLGVLFWWPLLSYSWHWWMG